MLGLKRWFFGLAPHFRAVIVAVIGAILLWGFITPMYDEFLKLLSNMGISGWAVVALSGIGLLILAKWGKHML